MHGHEEVSDHTARSLLVLQDRIDLVVESFSGGLHLELQPILPEVRQELDNFSHELIFVKREGLFAKESHISQHRLRKIGLPASDRNRQNDMPRVARIQLR